VSRLGPVERFRRPEYTGENRCLACTVLNVGVAATGSVLVALWVTVAGFPAVATGLAAGLFTLSLASVWLRGYLVPKTPTLARSLPGPVREAFGKPVSPVPRGVDRRLGSGEVPPDGGRPNGSDKTAVDVQRRLSEWGATERGGESSDGNERLTERFRERWRTSLDAVHAAREADGTDGLSAYLAGLGIDDGELRLADSGPAVVATVDGRRVGRWESRAALAADLAAADALADADGWASLSPSERGRLCERLRTLRERCPACLDALVTERRSVGCCSDRSLVEKRCETCDHRIAATVAE